MSEGGWFTLADSRRVYIRAARTGDYDGIAALCDGVFEDYDVFPGLVERYLASRTRMVHVAEDSNGRLVGCLASTVLDNGRTFVAQGARSAKDYERSGVQKIMRPINWREAKRRFPDMREDMVRLASIHVDFFASRADSVQRIHFTQLIVHFTVPLKPEQFEAITCSDNLDLWKSRVPIADVEPVSTSQFGEVLRDQEACRHLFPFGMVYSQSEMFELMEENVAEIYTGRGSARVLGLPGGRYDGDSSSGVHYASISICLPLRSKRGWMYEVAYFGTDHVGSILAHAFAQLSSFKDSEKLDINFYFHFHKERISSDTVTKVSDVMKQQLKSDSVKLLEQQILDIHTKPRAAKL